MAFSFSNSFSLNEDGFLLCENVVLVDLVSELEQQQNSKPKSAILEGNCDSITPIESTPLFVYSKRQIQENVAHYKHALQQESIKHALGYSVKANYSPALMSTMRQEGCWAVTVSGNEILLALKLGFSGSQIIFNGNGKRAWEIELAIKNRCFLNADSLFDLKHIVKAAKELNVPASVLLRLNPKVDPQVHPFLATGLARSKFGIDESQIAEALMTLKDAAEFVTLVGLHCHLGSTIETVQVFRQCLDVMLSLLTKLKKEKDINTIKYINIGGGLGIDYKKHVRRTIDVETATQKINDEKTWESFINDIQSAFTAHGSDATTATSLVRDLFQHYTKPSASKLIKDVISALIGFPILLRQLQMLLPTIDVDIGLPQPKDLVAGIKDVLKSYNVSDDITLLMEPGRSLIANTAVCLTKVIGCKRNNDKEYVVIDGAMNDVVRPAFYGAYHHIELAEPSKLKGRSKASFDVVGPICECGDFIGKERFLPYPHEGCLLAIFDVGAYCSSMASNYNMRFRPAEVIVEGKSWRIIRRADTLQDLLNQHNNI